MRHRFTLALALALLAPPLGCRNSSPQLWHAFSARFIDPDGRVFDPSGDQHTTSEGQAYALFFALTAGDRAIFNRVLAWTQSNLAAGDLSAHLPAWRWGKAADGSWKVLDPNSASDADTWLAYTLLEAGRLWNLPAHVSLGRAMLALIAKNEVANLPGFGPMLLPGPSGFQHGDATTLNPSYLPLFLFQRFAAVDPTGPWYAIASEIPRFLDQSARRGFAMDWVEYDPGDGFHPVADPPTAGSGASSASASFPVGGYDAIRVYLWAGLISPEVPARVSILNSIAGMGAYMATHDAPPEKVTDQGMPSDSSGPVGFSAALIPYLRALPDAQKPASAQIIHLGSQRNPTTGLYGNNADYYDQCLALFSTGFSTGKFSFSQAGELIVKSN
jgi:endo-1,4-beta-D-glucanase Y